MEGIRFDSLEGAGEEVLHAAFLSAFSDYEVPVRLSVEELRALRLRRGVSLAESLGAFDGRELVGFLLTGTGTWEGRRCAYDSGTGVVPAWRGRGLSKALVAETAARLAASGFEYWLLEVLVANEKAIRSYAGAGFTNRRRFSVREGALPDASARWQAAAAAAAVEIAERDGFEPRRIAGFRDWEPSWQNSDASVAREPGRLLVLEAREPGAEEVLGTVVATAGGSIAQLAVAPARRRRGIGRALLLALAARVPGGRLRYVNVQSDDGASLGLLSSLGLGGELEQWEMGRELGAGPRGSG